MTLYVYRNVLQFLRSRSTQILMSGVFGWMDMCKTYACLCTHAMHCNAVSVCNVQLQHYETCNVTTDAEGADNMQYDLWHVLVMCWVYSIHVMYAYVSMYDHVMWTLGTPINVSIQCAYLCFYARFCDNLCMHYASMSVSFCGCAHPSRYHRVFLCVCTGCTHICLCSVNGLVWYMRCMPCIHRMQSILWTQCLQCLHYIYNIICKFLGTTALRSA